MFSSIRKIHFVGIGGIGMSGIAEILLDQGFKVSGSDSALSDTTERLEKLGAVVYEGHQAANVGRDVDALVYSSAVSVDNPELKEARKRKIPVIRRAEMLAEVMRLKYGIGIAGTHGKTTTTSMVGLVLLEGGLDPTVIVGGKLTGLGGTNARLGKGEFIVVEADEYDRSFLSITPTIAVLTSLDTDHLDTYSDIEDIKKAFVEFALKVPFYGFMVLCLDEPGLQDIIRRVNIKKIITYGLSPQADIRAIDLKFNRNASEFTIRRTAGGPVDGKRIRLKVPGKHNVRNALAAISVGLELGLPLSAIIRGIEKFSGVYRRWELKGETAGVLLYDDYAHHPTECTATLEGAKSGWKDRRIVCVFQPHLYSRTRDFYEEFGKAFLLADVVVVTDIYPAREEPIQGITGELIVHAAKQYGHKQAHYVPSKTDVPGVVSAMLRSGDLVITMGAGDIWKYGAGILAGLTKGATGAKETAGVKRPAAAKAGRSGARKKPPKAPRAPRRGK